MKLIINSKNWTGEFYLKLYKSNRKNVIIYFKSWTGEVAQVVKVRVFWSADSSPTDSETWQFSSKIMNLDYRWVHIVRCNINKYVFGNPSFLSSQNTKITLSDIPDHSLPHRPAPYKLWVDPFYWECCNLEPR